MLLQGQAEQQTSWSHTLNTGHRKADTLGGSATQGGRADIQAGGAATQAGGTATQVGGSATLSDVHGIAPQYLSWPA